MKTSDLLVQCLENEGVRYGFGIFGKVLDIADSLSRSTSIQYVPVRHEQGAEFMADVYGRVAGKAGGLPGYLGSWYHKFINRGCKCNIGWFTCCSDNWTSRNGKIA